MGRYEKKVGAENEKSMRGVLALMLCFSLAACGNKENSANDSQNDVAKTYDVEVTVPASLISDEDVETLMSDAKASGTSEVVKNGTDSITFKMPQEEYDALLGAIKENVAATIDGYLKIKKIQRWIRLSTRMTSQHSTYTYLPIKRTKMRAALS